MTKYSATDPRHLSNALKTEIRTPRLIIRRARASDSPGISAMFNADNRAMARFNHWENEDFSIARVKSHWTNWFNTLEKRGYGTTLFGFTNKKPIVQLLCWSDYQGMNRIAYFTDKGERRRGFAKEAFQAAAERMHAFGHTVTPRIPLDNAQSMKFVMNLGYRPLGRRDYAGLNRPMTMILPR